MAFWKNKQIIAPLIALFAVLIFSLTAAFNVFEAWQLRFSDPFYGDVEPSDDIVIVSVDDQTLSELGEFQTWDRSNYAQMLNNLNAYDPKIVAFDFFFKLPRSLDGDQAFVNALQQTDIPVLPHGYSIVYQADDGQFIPRSPEEDVRLMQLIRDNVDYAPAVFDALPDSDEVIRHMIPGVYNPVTDEYVESLSFAVARLAQGGRERLDVPLDDGQLLIRYASTHGSDTLYSSVSFLNVYNNDYRDFNPETFRDKIVLVGPTADVLKDLQFTPLSSTQRIPGVEIHAHAIQTLLSQNFLTNMPLWGRIALIAMVAGAAAYIFLFTSIRWSLVFLVVFPVLYTIAAPFAFRSGLILDMVHPYLVLVTVFVAAYMYRYFTEFRQKLELKSAFSKYVNPSLVNEILNHPEKVKLGGEQKNVTVLFTDIEHFTTISEGLKPESLIALLNEYLEVMTNVVMSEGGTVDKYEGDAIMAFFGAPIAQEDHARRACRVALKMRQALGELMQKWENDAPLPGGEKKPLIDFRCGLSSGEVIVGNVGSSKRLEYTVIGDIVNLGSRLEGANKVYSTHVLMSEETYRQVSSEFEARELDTIRVVGKKQPIKVYELLGFKGDLPREAEILLTLYNDGIALYNQRKFAEALVKFDEILKPYPDDGPSRLYRQRCEILQNFPPAPDWDGVFEMKSK